MKKILSKILNFIKKFPFTSYVIFGFIVNLVWYLFKIEYDTLIGFSIMIIFAPLIFIADFFDKIFFYNNPYGSNFRFFTNSCMVLLTNLFFDIFILYTRKKLIPFIKSKINKESSNHDAS